MRDFLIYFLILKYPFKIPIYALDSTTDARSWPDLSIWPHTSHWKTDSDPLSRILYGLWTIWSNK